MYNLILLLGAIGMLPKWLLQKKYRGSLKQRLGFSLPPKANTIPTIWIHMVSVGEAKAITPIYLRLKKKYPTAAFYLSTTTKTGQEEIKRSFPEAFSHFYLPLDLSWISGKLVNRLKPDLFVLSEGDLWLNLLTEVKRRGGKVLLLNGKMSERSSLRFAKVPKFSKKLFSKIDHLCLQSETHSARFASLYVPKEKMTITGNLKLSIPVRPPTEEKLAEYAKEFGIKAADKVLTLASTHPGEEELLLPHLKGWKVLLAPRHLERLPSLKKFQSENVVIVNKMGILPICFGLSKLAIIGGSFLPGVGGHNIFEPIQSRIPVLFGPHMETQLELVKLILDARAGIQTSAETLAEKIPEVLEFTANAKSLSGEAATPADTTWEAIQYLL